MGKNAAGLKNLISIVPLSLLSKDAYSVKRFFGRVQRRMNPTLEMLGR